MHCVKSRLRLMHKGEFSYVLTQSHTGGNEMAILPTIEFLNPAQTIRMPVYSAELALIKAVEDELTASLLPKGNKEIILAIIRHLEYETDLARSALYRSALEMIVRRTPDDL